jgi:hypothetical protein
MVEEMIERLRMRPGPFWHIALKCPQENGGTLELLHENIRGNGAYLRQRVTYNKEGEAIVVLEELAKPGGLFEEKVRFDVRNPSPNKHIEIMARDTIQEAGELERSVCRGDAATRKRYYEILEANKTEVMKAKRR